MDVNKNLSKKEKIWKPGHVNVAVVMISLNEEHNIKDVCENITGWANEVFLVDSYSKDETIDIALEYGVTIIQRKFTNFGDQWNFALNSLPISSEWTMKLDPDERITEDLKKNIAQTIKNNKHDGIEINRHWWLMNTKLPIHDKVLRLWRTGTCVFTDSLVNEHPQIKGKIKLVKGMLEHHDSPNLNHWLEKQNRYTTAEAINLYLKKPLATKPKLFGSNLERRMLIKNNFFKIPFRYFILFLYYWIWKGLWKSGWVGYASARLWSDVIRLREYKFKEMQILGKIPKNQSYGAGAPDLRVEQAQK